MLIIVNIITSVIHDLHKAQVNIHSRSFLCNHTVLIVNYYVELFMLLIIPAMNILSRLYFV